MQTNPLPRAGICSSCGGPAHPYEMDISLDANGGTICGACTRAANKRRGRDPRQVDRHHKWKFGHDPEDSDADPNSPWLYVNLEAQEEALVNQKATLKGGPESGIKCFDCGTITRIAGEASVEEILAPLGYRPPEGSSPPKEPILICVCPKCERVTQWRRSFLERARAPR